MRRSRRTSSLMDASERTGGVADTRRYRLRHHAEDEIGATDRDRGVGGEGRFAQLLTVHLGAVGGAEVAHHGALAVPEDLGVLTARSGIRDGDVGIRAASDDGARAGDAVPATVDVDHRLPAHTALD